MTTRTSKQNTAAEVTIQVDDTGTQAGVFNATGDPIISYNRHANAWLLAHKTPTGTNCLMLDVHGSGPDAVTNAVAAAREHLRASQTTAVVPEGI